MKISDWSKLSTNQDQGDGLLPHHESITLRKDVIYIDGDITKKKREREKREENGVSRKSREKKQSRENCRERERDI